MRAFHTIAVPHKDILEGRLTLDTFAADLGNVYQNRGIDEYRDADTFFQKTYLTQGLQNLIGVVEKRLHGKGGDPVIQIQTPFGGGKTHALIALYHSAKQWGDKVVVIDGTSLSADDTFWALIEKQLTGKVSKFSEATSPGKDKIRDFLEHQQPVLILMDEVLEYTTKAAGRKIGDSNLASQTMAFMQELTEVASTLPQVCLVATLPSSVIEHYDRAAEDLFQKLQKVSGRKEIIYTPVEDNEITKIILRRLFSTRDEQAAKEIVNKFVSFAEENGILPAGVQPTLYRDKFMESYPFLPDVVDVLYHRWGSFPTFQRTRGVLRLLSLVIYSMKETTSEYITLADFDLASQEIRQELIKHIGQQYNGIISQDITSYASGAVKVNRTLGNAFMGLRLGERAARTIFLYSFSGAGARGSTLTEIKRNSTTFDNPPSTIAEAMEQFKRQLLYLHERNDMYFFSTEITLNKLLLINMENVKEQDIKSKEGLLLQSSLDRGKLEVYLWNESPDIPDTDSLKLIILDSSSASKKKDILTKRGQTQRIYKNTLFFLTPMDSEYPAVHRDIRENIALLNIESDPTLKLSAEQKREIKEKLRISNDNLKTSIRKLYRLLYIPAKGGELTEIDLGIPLYGSVSKLNEEVYETLRKKNEILENITPIWIREKYLSKNDYALTEQIYYSAYRTPGEARPVDRSVLEKGISEGVQKGLFGLGEVDSNDLPICAYFKEQPSISLSGKEAIIKDNICIEQKNKEEGDEVPALGNGKGGQTTITPPVPPVIGDGDKKLVPTPPVLARKETVQLKLNLSKGQASTLSQVLRYLSDKFQDITIEIKAKNGEISESDYENKIKEAFEQGSIDYTES
jgi:hypothetical protein